MTSADVATGSVDRSGGDRPSAVITGSSRGIGYGIARRLASDGWALTLSARNVARLREVEAELKQFDGPIQMVAVDLSVERSAAQLIEQHQAAYGPMNALVLAAGIGSAGPIETYPLRLLDKQFAVNVRTALALISAALPLLRAGAEAMPDRGGRIIALASIEGIFPEPGLAAYAASKAALLSLLRSVNVEQQDHGVTASAICPGYVDTDMSAWVADRISPESMIKVSDVVQVADMLLHLSPNAVVPYVTINRVGASAHEA